jgi:sulfite reductase beta subunit-like hemoprotein
MVDAWHTVFHDIVEERPVQADVHPQGLVKVTTTPMDEISPERFSPDQELIALEIEEEDRADLAKALREEGFSDAAVSRIVSHIPA